MANVHVKRPIIGISMGDPFGNGPEITVSALSDASVYTRCRPWVVGDYTSLSYACRVAEKLGRTAPVLHRIESVEDAFFTPGTIDVLDLGLMPEDAIPNSLNEETPKPFGVGASKLGGEAAFIDVEHALDPVYAQALGVNIDELLVSQPDSGEQALEIAEALIRSGAIDVIVLDSIAAMTTRAEIDGEMGDLHVGQLARLMSQAMRKLTAAISKSNCVAIFINQIREKIGVMYGNPETTPGGRALKFYASVRIDIRRTEAIKNGSEVIGNRTRAKIVKNKCAPPFKEAFFDIMYGEGISKWGEMVDLAVQLELINKSGSWFSIGDERIGQGRDSAKQYLIDHPDVADRIEQSIRDNMWKLQGKNAKPPASVAAKPVSISADDFNDD